MYNNNLLCGFTEWFKNNTTLVYIKSCSNLWNNLINLHNMNLMIVLKINILILIKKYNPNFFPRPVYNYNLVTII